MSEERLRKKLIHEVMLMAYEEGIKQGRKEVMDAMKKKAEDFSHSPQKNSYSDEWRKLP